MLRGSLTDLAAFIAIADQLSFRAAAARFCVSASALGDSTRQLGERVGVRLLNRTTRSVSLTDAGVRPLEPRKFVRRHRREPGSSCALAVKREGLRRLGAYASA